jgi:hypothetical protein
MCPLLGVPRSLLYSKPPRLEDAKAQQKQLQKAIDRPVVW